MSAAVWRDDDPWRRLAWTLPLALVLAALWLGLFATLLSLGRPPEPQQQPAIEAQIVTLPPPAAPTPPAPPQPAETKPPPPTVPMPPPPPPPVPELAPRKPPPPVKRPPPRPAAPPRETSAPPKAETPPPAAPPSPAQSRPLAGGQMGARAIYKPMPRIPDELRRENFQGVAVVRFHVAVDGSATVELVQATTNVALNKLLLDTFKTWRFFPAMENGRPMPSTIEIRVPISIQ